MLLLYTSVLSAGLISPLIVLTKRQKNKMKKFNNDNYFESSDGTVRIWIEQGTSIKMKVITETNDPVELSEEEAIEIANILTKFSKEI